MKSMSSSAAWSLLAFSVLATAGSACTTAAEDPKTAPAIKAAQEWLAKTDANDHGPAWDESASVFRATLAREAWSAMVTGVRAPLGKMKSRKLTSATFSTTIPGAPDGEYVIIQYATSFENKAEAIETITPMLDKDGVWRVSGYFIK